MKNVKNRIEAEEVLKELKNKDLSLASHDFGIVYLKNSNSYFDIDVITNELVEETILRDNVLAIVSKTIKKRYAEFSVKSFSLRSAKYRNFVKRYENSLVRYLNFLQKKYDLWTLDKEITISDLRDARFA